MPSVTCLGNNRTPNRATIRTRTTSFANTPSSRGLPLGWRWMVAEADCEVGALVSRSVTAYVWCDIHDRQARAAPQARITVENAACSGFSCTWLCLSRAFQHTGGAL